MNFIQILAILFGLFALSRVVLRFKDGEITFKELFLWSSIWIMFIVISVLPSITIALSELAGIGRGVDLVMYTSIIVMYYLIFKLYVRMENIEQQITQVVRDEALSRIAKKKK